MRFIIEKIVEHNECLQISLCTLRFLLLLLVISIEMIIIIDWKAELNEQLHISMRAL